MRLRTLFLKAAKSSLLYIKACSLDYRTCTLSKSYIEIRNLQSFVGLLDFLKVTVIFSDVHEVVPVFQVLRMVTQLPGVDRSGRR